MMQSARGTDARLAGWLFLASGLLTVANNYLPGAAHLDKGVLNAIGAAAMVFGALTFALPWDRWPERASLAVFPFALALIVLGNLFGGVGPYSYAVYFVLLFMWVGVSQSPKTAFAVMPVAVAAYILPGLVREELPAGSVSSVTVAIPICLLVAETISRTVRRANRREAQYQRLAELSREAEERFRLAFENAPIGMALVAPDGSFLRVNHSLSEIVGYSPDELVTKTFQDITHPQDLEADLAHVRQMLAGEIRTYSMDKRYLHVDGHVVWINLSVSLVWDEDGAPRYFISQIEDISERKRTEAALLASQERTRRILETAGDAFVAIDDAGHITDWNRQAEVTFGWEAADVLGRPLDEVLIPPDSREAHRRGLQHFLATGEGPVLGERLELSALHRDGHAVSVEMVIWALREGDGWAFNAFLRDISERKAMEEELQRQALVDELTGLRNRRGFLAVAEPLIQIAQRKRRDMALLYIDLDNMKAINDRHGHAAGDQALIETAELLRGTFRDSDIVARMGGDEFCVLLSQNGIEAKAVMDRLEDRLKARHAAGLQPAISLSVGVAKYHWDERSSIETLIDQADAAMYEEKSKKRVSGAPLG